MNCYIIMNLVVVSMTTTEQHGKEMFMTNKKCWSGHQSQYSHVTCLTQSMSHVTHVTCLNPTHAAETMIT